FRPHFIVLARPQSTNPATEESSVSAPSSGSSVSASSPNASQTSSAPLTTPSSAALPAFVATYNKMPPILQPDSYYSDQEAQSQFPSRSVHVAGSPLGLKELEIVVGS
ncbi:hypothetical protein C8F04DRAFT_1193741, partial [Mycena alexandri]